MFDFGDIKDDEIGTIGFDAKAKKTSKDFLNRKKTGEQLSDLIESTEYPMVVAMDGAWGSGKSHFLKLWAGAHELENNGTARVIYFDAFKHDYLDDPLIALTLTISSHLENENTQKTKQIIDGFKRLAPAIGKSALRISAAVATAGASEAAASVMGDAFVDASAKEISETAEGFWKTEQSRILAMEKFKNILAELTGPCENSNENNDSKSNDAQKLIIIVDELDRCRPDYALSLLEILKHFFNVSNVHIVLGVRLEALENSVKARYGNGIDASLYLQKFITISMRLPIKYDPHSTGNLEIHYLGQISNTLKQSSQFKNFNWKINGLTDWLQKISSERNPSLRGVQRILLILSLIPRNFERNIDSYKDLIIAGAILKVQSPSLYNDLLGSKSIDENREICDKIKRVFSFRDPSVPTDEEDYYASIWSNFLIPDVLNKSKDRNPFHVQVKVDTVANLYRDSLEVFEPFNPK